MGETRLIATILLFISGLLEIGYEIYTWLRYGAMAGITGLTVLQYYISERNWPWLWNPSDWVGVHSLLKPPLIAFLWLLAFLLVLSLLDYKKQSREQGYKGQPE